MSPFATKIINAVKEIPKGKVASYGQIALMAGHPRAARQVGWILHAHGGRSGKNGIPWWRVINNSGKITIKNQEYLPHEQKHLLENEGIEVSDNFEIDIEKYRF